jgi:hypothetical protein
MPSGHSERSGFGRALAEGEELGSNGLLICKALSWSREKDWNPTVLLKAKQNLFQ